MSARSPPGSASGVETEVAVDGRTVRVTHPDRVLWPLTGAVKAEVIDYYLRVAGVLLPHVRGRPVTP